MNLWEAAKKDYKQLLFVCAAFLATALASYFYVGVVMRRQIDLHSRSEMLAYQTALRSLILAHEDALQHAAVSVGMAMQRGAGPDELQDILKNWTEAFRKQKDIKDVFVSVYGYLDGNYLDGTSWIPGEFYYPKTAPWMRGAITQNGIFHSKPYIDPRTGNAVNAVSMVVFDENGESHGVLALDYLLNPVIDQVKAYKVADTGYGILMDGSFGVLTHPESRYIGGHIDDLPGYAEIHEKMKNLGDDVLVERILDAGEEYIGFFSLLENGWRLGIIAPVQYYYSEVKRVMPVIAVLCAMLALALCCVLVRLSAAKMRSEEESRSKSSFLARMSHEIRTPMNAIIGMGELAAREYGTPQAFEYIAAIRHAASDLLSIINDILDYSKVESGTFQISSAQYETSSMLNDVLAIIGVRAKEKSLDLITEIDPNIPGKLIGDEVRVRQILLNLLSNAVKYTGQGGVVFIAGYERCDDGVNLTFTVEDSGIGIKPEHLGYLFGDFVRLDQKGAKHHIEGTGLGLSISRSLCRAMGGDITVESEYGKGSSFTAAIKQGVADWTPGSFSGKGLYGRESAVTGVNFTAPGFRVLVVDDIATNLTVARGMLSQFQVDISTCLSGREAVDTASEREFGMIFIDHMMPGMDGIETARAIRRLEGRYDHVPLVALTANAMAGTREMFLSKGFDDYLSKPIETAKLNEIMEKWIPGEFRVFTPDDPIRPPEDPGALRIEGIDTKKGLERMRGSMKDYIEALDIFCRDVESALTDLKDVSEESVGDFTIRVHALKGASANIGALALSDEAAFFEDAGKRRDLRAILDGIEVFRGRLAEVVFRIRRAILPPDGACQTEGSAFAPDSLLKLKDAISSRDIGAVDLTLGELSAAASDGRSKNALLLVSNHVLMADFEEAEAIVDDMLEEAGS
ncbi:MAG: response regulator [Synergistaceae bacterium]|jgi:signal transduction histidine kinase/CheY-like chemotaxis protein|nr:response regulator [Synergistaceae bacterium]